MNGNIEISGLIGTILDENGNVKEKGVDLIDVMLQVKEQPEAISFDVHIINSQGGSFDTGYLIYDYLKGLKKPIRTIGEGMVASIATIIFAAGTRRILKPNSEPFFHLPQGGVSGSSDDIEFYSQRIKDAEKKMLKTYQDDFGLSETEILPLLRQETTLTVEQAYKLGIANEPYKQMEIVAYFDKDNTKINTKKKNMSKPNEKSILAKIKEILVGAAITNKIVFDAEGKELDFYELEDSATIELGAKANYDGTAANGEYSVPSENDPALVETYVFENGVLLEIKEADVAAEEEADSEEMQALKEENENLKTQLAEKETAVVDLTGEVTALKESNSSYKKAIAAIKAIETEHTPAQPAKAKQNPTATPAKENRIAAGITNLTKNRQ